MSVLNLRISSDKHKSVIKQQYKEETFINVVNKLGKCKFFFFVVYFLVEHLPYCLIVLLISE